MLIIFILLLLFIFIHLEMVLPKHTLLLMVVQLLSAIYGDIPLPFVLPLLLWLCMYLDEFPESKYDVNQWFYLQNK